MSDDKLKSLIDLYSKISNSNDNISLSKKPDLELIKALMEARARSEKKGISKEERIELLQKRYLAFSKNDGFAIGETVKWKPGLRNKGGLDYEDVAIILDILNKPIFDETKDSGSPYFKEPLDMVIAFLDSDNDFITLYVDSRRLCSTCKSSSI